MYRLSKSKLMSASQCAKRLYLEVHQPELAHIDSGLESRFDTGHRVGEVARSLHPEGRLIGHGDNPVAALEETREALMADGDLLLFEPAFQHGGVLVRADLLFRRDGRYRLVEVKATTGVADHHLQDAAIQAWVIGGAGCPVDVVSIAHIDRSFVYLGGGDYRGLLKQVDVTQDIAPLLGRVPAMTLECQRVLAGPLPDIAVGKQCGEPYACPFLRHCDRDAPEFPLSMLGRSRTLKMRLASQGYLDLRDVPQAEIGEGIPRRIWNAIVKGETYQDPRAADLLRDLEYPRYYLDFETVHFAVPIWIGTRPYEQLPFQWSCHVEQADGALTHHEFLDTTGEAPMLRCMEALVAVLGTRGPVFAYSGFEGRILREGAVRHPALAVELRAIADRLIDLLPIARANYYHPAQNGSWSIKAVLPTIAPDLDYTALGEVSDGGDAPAAYLEMTDRRTSADRRDALATALRAYCGQDAAGMVRIVHHFLNETPTFR